MDGRWRIELLGGLSAAPRGEGTPREAWRGSGMAEGPVVTRFRTQKTGMLLGYLAYSLPRAQPREVLIELLWPEREPQAGRQSLSQALCSLRHQLEPPGAPVGTVLRADRTFISLNPAAVTTDVGEFEAALQAAERAASSTERVQRLTQAVELYRGELLRGYSENWVLVERELLAERYFQALRQLVVLLEEAGDLSRALQYARRGVSADPLREEAHRELMRLHAAAGQPEAGLRQCRELERILQEEFGDRPAAATRALAGELAALARERPPTRAESEPAAPVPQLSPPAPLVPSPATPPTGTVTFLLTEIEASMALWERAGEAFRAALADHHALLRRQFREYGGYEVKPGTQGWPSLRDGPQGEAHPRFARVPAAGSSGGTEGVGRGDAFLVAFARAGDALACAVAGQKALAAHPWLGEVGALRVRMALHTGDVELRQGDYHGLALHHAQRLLVAAHGGQILCSEETAILLRRHLEPGVWLTDLGLYRMRGEPAWARLFQVEYPAMAHREFPPPNADIGYGGNLPPQFTRFFDREDEIARLLELLPGVTTERRRMATAPRLVTLTGSGGSGKTRLALEVARQLVETWHGATWFVTLSDLAEAQFILDAVRDAMRLPRSPDAEPLEQVVAALSRQPSLLVLDCFEHLMTEGAPLVRSLLERVPSLTCMVTSRQRLDLAGEREFLVLPLPVPKAGPAHVASPRSAPAAGASRPPAVEGESLAALVQHPSVQLFVDRAQAVRPDFQVTSANASAVAALCRRLEGIPLALELAAARAQVLTSVQMLAHLEKRFDFLVSRKRDAAARHRTLRAAIDWSYRLLSPELQRFFAQLSVFRGGWTLAAAEAVCQEGAPADAAERQGPSEAARAGPALDYLEQLRACSLVLAEEGGEQVRFRMLDTLREYSREQLTPEELAALRRQHATYHLALAEAVSPELQGRDLARQVEQLESEHDNLRAALEWSIEHGEAELGLRLGEALAPFWEMRGYWREGRERLDELLALPGGEARTAARAMVLDKAGVLANDLGDHAAARSLHAESLAIFRELGDRRGIAGSLHALANVLFDQREYDGARSLYEESVAIRRELGNRSAIAWSLRGLGNVARAQGDYATARSLFEESLAIQREGGDRRSIGTLLNNLGTVALNESDDTAAAALFEEGLALQRELGSKQGIAGSLSGLGAVALAQENYEAARALFEESLAITRELGDKRGLGFLLYNLANVLLYQDDAGSARACYEESLAIQRELDDEHGIASALEGLARVAGRALAGDHATAEALGVSEAHDS